MHDVDLLPQNSDLKYDYPPADGVMHIAAPGLHPKYNYPSFIGGILLLRNEHFSRVNGMSNRYFGWGLEDDEFYVRLKDAKIKVYRPTEITTDMTNSFVHNHDRVHRRRDTAKCYNQKEETRKRDKHTGLNTIKYNVSARRELTIDGVGVTIFNVNLECDKSKTPWCECEINNNNKYDNSKSKAKKGLR